MTRTHSGPLWPELGLYILLLMMISFCTAAPLQETTEIAESSQLGCYYNYNRYSEGDRILTNEPCLNCTCHNKMLMCYLRVCPFTKPIGQDCIIEKREDQCCPIITCPEVPVELLEHNAGQQSTSLASPDRYGCSIDSKFYPDGAQLPSNPRKPCELCYCIRNMTSCVMQECTLHVDGCRPIYNKGVCCPVRYNCDHDDDIDESMLLEDMSTTTTMRPTEGFVITTTMPTPPVTDCMHDGEMYADGALLTSDKPCEHCYCMRGDIVCAVQECGAPMETEGKNCTVIATKKGQCCPEYKCDTTMDLSIDSTEATTDDDSSTAAATTVGIPMGDIQTTVSPTREQEPLTTAESPKELDSTTLASSDMDDVHNEIEHDEVIDEKHTTQSSLSSSSSSSTSPSSEEITTDSYDELPAVATTVQPLSETGGLDHRIDENEKEKEQPTTEGIDIPSDDKDLQEHIDDDDHVTEKKPLPESPQTQSPVDDEDQQVSVTTVRPSQPEEEKEEEQSSDITTMASIAAATTATVGTMAIGGGADDKLDKESDETTVKFDEPITTAQSIVDDSDIDINTVIPSIVPGEGYCLVEGKSYKNNSAIPSTSKCEIACVCVNSIVQCESIKCPPPPAHVLNCQPIYDEQKSCCPTYDCSSDSTERIDIDDKQQMTDRTHEITETTSIKSLEDDGVTELPIVAHDIKQDDVKKPMTEEDITTESQESMTDKPNAAADDDDDDDDQSTESKPIIVMDDIVDGTTESVSQTEKIPHSIDTVTEIKPEEKTESTPMLINVEDETATTDGEHPVDDGSTTEGGVKHDDQDQPMLIIVEDETKKSDLDDQITDKPMLIVVDDITTSSDVSESPEITQIPIDIVTDTPSIDFKVDDLAHTTMKIIIDDDEQTPTESSSSKSPVDEEKEEEEATGTTDISPAEPSPVTSSSTDSTSDSDSITKIPEEIPSDDDRTDKPQDVDIVTSIPGDLSSTKPSDQVDDDEQQLSITPSTDKLEEPQSTSVTSSPTEDSDEKQPSQESTTFGSIKDEDDNEKSTTKAPQFDDAVSEVDITTLSSVQMPEDKSEQPEITDDDKQISPTTISSEQDISSETSTDKKPLDTDIPVKEPVGTTLAPASDDDSMAPQTVTHAPSATDTDDTTKPAEEQDSATKVSPTEEEPKVESTTKVSDDEELKEPEHITEPAEEEISTKLPEADEQPKDKEHVTVPAEEETSTKVPSYELPKEQDHVTDAYIEETSAAEHDQATTIASIKPDEIESQEPDTTDKIPMDLSQKPIDSATDKPSSTDSATEHDLPTTDDKESDSTEIPDKHIVEPVTIIAEEKPTSQDTDEVPTIPTDIDSATSVPVIDTDKPTDKDIAQSTPAIPSKEQDEEISEPATTAQTVVEDKPIHDDEIVPADEDKIQPTTLSSVTESDQPIDSTGKPGKDETEAETETKTPTDIDGTGIPPVSDDSSVAPESEDIDATTPAVSPHKPDDIAMTEADQTVTEPSDSAHTTMGSIDFKIDEISKTPISDGMKPTEPSEETETSDSTEIPMEDDEQSKTEQPAGQEVSTPMYLPPVKEGEISPIGKPEPETEQPIETPTEDSEIHKLEITTASEAVSEPETTDKTIAVQDAEKPTEEKPDITETDVPETTAKDIVPDSESHTVVPPESVNLMKGEDVTTVIPIVEKDEDVIIVTAISIPETTTKAKPVSDDESPATPELDDKNAATDKPSDMSDVSSPTTTRTMAPEELTEHPEIESDIAKPIVVTVLPESAGDKSTVQPIDNQSVTDSSIPEEDKSIPTESAVVPEEDQKETPTDKPITDDESVSTVPDMVTPPAIEDDSSTPVSSVPITEVKPQKDEISTDSPISGEPTQTEQPKPSDIDTIEPVTIVPYLGETKPESDKDFSTVQTPIDEMSTDGIVDSSSDESIIPTTESSDVDSQTDAAKPDSSTDKEAIPESVTVAEEQEILTHKPIESMAEPKPIGVEPISTDSPIDESSEQPEDKTELPLESEKDLPVTTAPESIQSSTHAKPLADDEKYISVATILPELMAGQTTELVTKSPEIETDITQSSEDDSPVTTPESAAKPEVTSSTEFADSKPIDVAMTTSIPDEKPIGADDIQPEIDVTSKQATDEVATSKPEIESDSTDLEGLSDVHTEPSIPSEDSTDLMPIDKEPATDDLEGSGVDSVKKPSTEKPSATESTIDEFGTDQGITDKIPLTQPQEEVTEGSGKPELPVDSITSKPDDHTEHGDIAEIPTEASGEKQSPAPIESVTDKSSDTPITQLDDHAEGSGASTDMPEVPVDKQTDVPVDESSTTSALDKDEDHSKPSEEDLASEKETEAPFSQSTDKPFEAVKPGSEDQATEPSVDTEDHTKEAEDDIGSDKGTGKPITPASHEPTVPGKPESDDQVTETGASATNKPESIDVTAKSPSDDSMIVTTAKSDSDVKLTESPDVSVTEKLDTVPMDIVTIKPSEEQPEITPSEQQTEQPAEKPLQSQTEQPADQLELTTAKSDGTGELSTDEVGTEEPAQPFTGRPATDEAIAPATDKYPDGVPSDKPAEEVTKTPFEEQPEIITEKSSEEPSDMVTKPPTKEEPEEDLISLTTSSPTEDQPEISSEKQPIENVTDKVSEEPSKTTDATSDLGVPTDLAAPSATDKVDESVTDKINVLPELDEQVTDKTSDESTDDETATPSSEKTDKPVEEITEKAPIVPVECTSDSCSINLSESTKTSTTEKVPDVTTVAAIIETDTDAVTEPHDKVVDIDSHEPAVTVSQISDDFTTISSVIPLEGIVTVQSDEVSPPVTSGEVDVDDDKVTTVKSSDVLVDEKTPTPIESIEGTTSLPTDRDEDYAEDLDHRIDEEEKRPSITKKPTTASSPTDIDVTTVEITSEDTDTTVKTPVSSMDDEQQPSTTDDKQPEEVHDDSIDVTTASVAGPSDEADTTVKVPIVPTQESVDQEQEPVTTQSTIVDKHPEVSIEDIDVTTAAAIEDADATTAKAPISPTLEQIDQDQEPATTQSTTDDKHDVDINATTAGIDKEDVTVKEQEAVTTQSPTDAKHPEVLGDDLDVTTVAAAEISAEDDTTVKVPIVPTQEPIEHDQEPATTQAPIDDKHPEVPGEDIDVTTTAAIVEVDTTVKAPIPPAQEPVNQDQQSVTTQTGQHEDDSDVTTAKAPIELEKGSDATESTADDKHDIDVTTVAAVAMVSEIDATVKPTNAPTQAPVEQEKESLPSHGAVTPPPTTESTEDDRKTDSPLDQYTHKPIYDGPGTTEADDVHASSQSPGYESGYPSGPESTGVQYPSAGYPEPEEDYNDEEDPTVFGPGTCRYGGKLYVSAQQIPRDDPCDFCFCFRSDIICLQQSCPPPISGCHEEPINGFCCPRYECPVSMATVMNVTTSTTTTSTTLPPHFLHHAYNGAATRSGCLIQGTSYQVGEIVQSASGPCMHCMCGGDGQMQCEPKVCTPEPMLRQMIAIAAARRR